MLAFTFPGQGSQRPGMGRPWAGEESWELVGEASEIAERDLGRLLLEGDADELKDTRNAQLCTFVSSLVVLDAIERTRPRRDVLCGPQPRRVHRARRNRRAVVRRGGPARGRARPRRCTRRARISRGRCPRCSASTTTRSRSRAAARTATCGSRTSTLRDKSSSQARPKVSPPPRPMRKSSARRRSCRFR